MLMLLYCFPVVAGRGRGRGEGLGRREGGLARLVKVANIIRQIGVFVL